MPVLVYTTVTRFVLLSAYLLHVDSAVLPIFAAFENPAKRWAGFALFA